jgi:hypothetical protein
MGDFVDRKERFVDCPITNSAEQWTSPFTQIFRKYARLLHASHIALSVRDSVAGFLGVKR